MVWIWVISAVLVLAAGLRYRHRLHSRGEPAIDDDAIRHIIGTGTLPRRAKDARTDMDEAKRAEEEFWSETWDEPEEYRP